MVGNQKLVSALSRIKSYFDYGTFTPIQVASILALEGPQDCVGRDLWRTTRTAEMYSYTASPHRLACRPAEGDDVRLEQDPRAVPSATRPHSSSQSCLLQEAKVAVSPGIGFGEHGDEYITLLPDRKRRAYTPGTARNQTHAPQCPNLAGAEIANIRGFSDVSCQAIQCIEGFCFVSSTNPSFRPKA